MDADHAIAKFYQSNQPRLTVERLIDFRTLQERNKKAKTLATPRERRKSRHRLSVSRRGQLEHLRNKVKSNFEAIIVFQKYSKIDFSLLQLLGKIDLKERRHLLPPVFQ